MTETNATWYYGKSGQQIGPIDLAAVGSLIQQGLIQPHDPVWTPGMSDWQAAGTLPQLAAYLPSSQLQSAQPFTAQQPVQQPFPGQYPYAPPMGMLNYQSPQLGTPQYAGFWLRFAAYFIDAIITGIGGAIIGGLIGAFMGIAGGFPRNPNNPSYVFTQLGIQGVVIIGVWLYHALMESSSLQASIGKMAVGIRVTDMEGNRISFGRASGRHFAKWLSSLSLLIGFMMAGWTERKQALHDIVASCLVVRR